MIKKITSIILLFAFLCMFSCAPQESPSNTQAPPNDTQEIPNEFKYYFDMERTNKPSSEEVLSIELKTPIKEVIDRLGKPHDFGPTSGHVSLMWEADSGEEYYIVFIYDSLYNDFLKDLFETGTAIKPILMNKTEDT